MLRMFSKFQRSGKAILLVFSAVLLLGLILFYGAPNQPLSPTGMGGVTAEDKAVIAKVGNKEVTLLEFRSQLASMMQMYSRGGGIDPRLVKSMKLDQQVLDRLVEDRIVQNEAERLGFTGTNQEISDQITKAFTDPDTGKFMGKEEYIRSLRLRGESPEKFEEGIRHSLAASKMRTFLTAGSQASDKEIEEAYKADNTKIEVAYATIEKDKIKDIPKPTEAELQTYFDGHKDEFKATDSVRKVEYLFIPTDKVVVNLTDEMLKAEYEKSKQQEPRVSIIKLNVPSSSPEDEATVRAKINELNGKVREAEGKPAEDFAAVARGNSQDTSKANGGDIGYIKKDANKKNDWHQRAIGQGAGTVDGPFRDGNSWYIMKITEVRDVPFAEMKPTLVAGAKNRGAYAKANEIANRGYELFTENKDLNKTAEIIAGEMKVKPEELIRSTPYFKKGDTLPDIGSNPTFEDHVKDLKKGEIADKIGIPNGFAIPRLTDVIDGNGALLNFEQAKNQIVTKLTREKEANAAQQKAAEIVNAAKNADEFKALATKAGFEVKTDVNNLTSLPFPNLQTGSQVKTAVLALKQGDVTKSPIKTGAGSYLIFAATKRTDPDMNKLAEQKTTVKQRLVAEKASMMYDSYIKDTRKKYETSGKLTIDRTKIDAYLNSLSATQPPVQNQ
jgi:peptidyl-prolyl cis-trans isomerase D